MELESIVQHILPKGVWVEIFLIESFRIDDLCQILWRIWYIPFLLIANLH